MANALSKLAPLAAVAGLAGYSLMPYLSPSGPPIALKSGEQKDAPRIEANLLDPKLDPPVERNPFELHLAPPPVAGAARAPGNGKASSKAAEPGPRAPEGMVLGATLVHGSRRLAIINGRVYGEGEAVAPPTADAPPITLARVEHDRVWLALPVRAGRPAKPVALAYAAPGAAHAGGARGAPATAPAAEPGDMAHLQDLVGHGETDALLGLMRSLLGDRLAAPQSPGGRGAARTQPPRARPGGGPPA